MCAEKRIHIGERMKYMPMGYFNAQSLGSLTAAATSTMEDLESMSFAVIARTVVGMIRTTIFSLAILCFDWRIGLVFLLGMLLFLWVNSLLLKKSRELSPGRLAAQTRLVDAVLEYIQGMSVVRAFHGDKAANQTLNRTIEETEQQNFKLERKRIPYNVLEQIVLRVTAVAAILFSIWFFLQGSMTLFTCLMVVVSAFLVYSELESAGEMFFDAAHDRRLHRPGGGNRPCSPDGRGRLRADAETLRYFLRACGLFLWRAENHPRCQLYHPGGDNHCHRGALRLRQDHPHQSYGKVLGCGQRCGQAGRH